MPSSVAKHTIPPFYACYFLRSLASPGTTYIGSTPAPPRRKRQHNGDLTQGAYKTARARPWEMECIVYGFSSKIAALQLEWAWAKPHLSRHLKFLAVEHSADGVTSDTAVWVGMPLFPSTSMTPGQTRWGKPKRRMARPPSTPNARLLAMRALLRSEPFCGWGLKLAFFTEWSWLAYQRLEAANQAPSSISAPHSTTRLQLERFSRSGKPLHPLYPMVVCDFAGVDGKRIPLVHVSPQHRIDAGVADQPIKKRLNSSKKHLDTEETPQWSETLPRSANLKGLDACVQDFTSFPSPQPPPLSTDLTKKVKRVTKASKEAAIGQSAVEDEEAEKEAEDEDASAEGATTAISPAEAGSASALVLHRMRFDDLDVEESEWRRFEQAISAHLSSSSNKAAGGSMSDFMQTCVQRYIAAQDARTINDAVPAPTAPCAICDESIDLTRQLDFVLCPSPPRSTLPNATVTTSSVAEAGSMHIDDQSCSSVYHLSCLASSFLQQRDSGEGANSSMNTVLPTHGVCPHHAGEQKETALWSDVVRAMYRRSERFERLLQLLIRSGRTLTEHLNPPEVEATAKIAKTGKSKGRAKAAIEDESQVDLDAEQAEQGKTVKKAKATAGRKRRQPAVGVAEEALDSISEAQVSETSTVEEKKAKRKAPRKAKTVDPTDVIDLT
ncbi:probable Structure-specific endonuclease subunit SLX1 [Ustilago trichophora]|uniref:Probable Structure-specific endonuclease subunit SLX1 n=1 Tax=Ustilago trichophora TaxID=86804 RepID=A0A5C3DXJ1_9BASI|nr:probable Structure-specific endonuclease subunit SLX1 [Ustilago trichophora]